MPESNFRRASKRTIASAILTAGVNTLKSALKQKSYVTHSVNTDDAYACAVYYGNSLAYGVDGDICIGYANTDEEDYDIYFTRSEEWVDRLNTRDSEVTGFFADQEKAKKKAFRAAKGRGKMPPSAQMSHEEFYKHGPNGYGRDWAYEYAVKKANSFPNDKQFRLVVFNAAPYSSVLEDGTVTKRRYKVMTCMLNELLHEVDSVVSFINENSSIHARRAGGVSINKSW